VHDANAKSRVGVMKMRGRPFVRDAVSVGMKVDVSITIMFVFMSVHSKGFA